MNKIEEALVGWWGQRCTVVDGIPYDDECPCCQAWAEYDAMRDRLKIAEYAFGQLDPEDEAK